MAPSWPPAPELRRAELTLQFRGGRYAGQLVAPAAAAGPRPLVLVVHNYQGLKFFDVDVAEYLARVGYAGLAVDLYGELVPDALRLYPEGAADSAVAAHRKACFEAMVTLDHDHERFRALLDAWLALGREHALVDGSRSPAAIGYCFGGMAVLEGVRGGLDLSGVVSFHGLLQTGEDPNPALHGAERPPLKLCENRYNRSTVVLIENGADDHLVTADSKARFVAEMDAAGVDWTLHEHARTPHGFALPPTLGAPGRLKEAADRRSTVSLLALLREVFPGVRQAYVPSNAAGTPIPR